MGNYANAGFVARHDLGGAQNGLRLIGLDFEPGLLSDEHVHQRALAHIEPERVVEQTAQPLVGKRLEALEVDRQRMNARPALRQAQVASAL